MRPSPIMIRPSWAAVRVNVSLAFITIRSAPVGFGPMVWSVVSVMTASAAKVTVVLLPVL